MQNSFAPVPGGRAPALSPSGALGSTVSSFVISSHTPAGGRPLPQAFPSVASWAPPEAGGGRASPFFPPGPSPNPELSLGRGAQAAERKGRESEEKLTKGAGTWEGRQSVEGSQEARDSGRSGEENLESAWRFFPTGDPSLVSASEEEHHLWRTLGYRRDGTEERRWRTERDRANPGRHTDAFLIPRERCYGCCVSSVFLSPERHPNLEATQHGEREEDGVGTDVGASDSGGEQKQDACQAGVQVKEPTVESQLSVAAQGCAFEGHSISGKRDIRRVRGKKRARVKPRLLKTVSAAPVRLEFAPAKTIEKFTSLLEVPNKGGEVGGNPSHTAHGRPAVSLGPGGDQPLALEPNAPEHQPGGVSFLGGATGVPPEASAALVPRGREAQEAFLREETARSLVMCSEAMSANFRSFHAYLRHFCKETDTDPDGGETGTELLRRHGLLLDGETPLKGGVFLDSGARDRVQFKEKKGREAGRGRTRKPETKTSASEKEMRDREHVLASYALRHRDALAATLNYVFELHCAAQAARSPGGSLAGIDPTLAAGSSLNGGGRRFSQDAGARPDPRAFARGQGVGEQSNLSPKAQDETSDITASLESLRMALKVWDLALILFVLPSRRRRINLMEWQRLWVCRTPSSFSSSVASSLSHPRREEELWSQFEKLALEEQDGAWTRADAVNVAWRINKLLCRFLCRADFASWLAACDRLGLQSVSCLCGVVAAVEDLQRAVAAAESRDSVDVASLSRETPSVSPAADENFEAAVAAVRAVGARVVFLFAHTASSSGSSASETPAQSGSPPLAFALGPEERRAWGLLSLSFALMVGNVAAAVASVFDVSEAFVCSSQAEVFPFSLAALASSHTPCASSTSATEESRSLSSAPSLSRSPLPAPPSAQRDGWSCALLQESFVATLFWSLFPSVSLHSQFLFFLRVNAPTLLALQAEADATQGDEELTQAELGTREHERPESGVAAPRGQNSGELAKGSRRGGATRVCRRAEPADNERDANVDLAAFDLDAADRLVLAFWLSRGNPEGATHSGALQLLHLLIEDVGLSASFPPFFFPHIVDLLFLADAFAPLPPGVAVEARCDVVMEYGASLLANNQLHASIPYLQEAARVPALVPAVLDLLRNFLVSSVHAFSDFRDRAAPLQDLDLSPPPSCQRANAGREELEADLNDEVNTNEVPGCNRQSPSFSLDPCAILLHDFAQACGCACFEEARRALSGSPSTSLSPQSHALPVSGGPTSSEANASDEERDRTLLLLQDSFCFLLFRARRKDTCASPPVCSFASSPCLNGEEELDDEHQREGELCALRRQIEALDCLVRGFCRLGYRHCACLLAALSGSFASSSGETPEHAAVSPTKSLPAVPRLLEASLRALSPVASELDACCASSFSSRRRCSFASLGRRAFTEGRGEAGNFGDAQGERRQKRRRARDPTEQRGSWRGGQDPTESSAEETEGTSDLSLLKACDQGHGARGGSSLPCFLVFLALYAKRRHVLELFLRKHDAHDLAWLHKASSLTCLGDFLVPGFVSLVAFVGSPQVSPSVPAFFVGCLLFDALRLLRLCTSSHTLIAAFNRRNLSLLATSWRRCLDAILLQTAFDAPPAGMDWRSPELQRSMVSALVLAESRCVA
ncbi:conserved hypothetical protein [Neospora caninum Liverpool]|uniref:Uncharacterized protein n=1 Tax=Neospora caninum (strain Liverpool) TaxID=572307 RepID=F0VB07_NEOCL|nr:conserved hypothetical protein [Neospora caninum Liverpool]CBZ51383.1 conserved hypothetical protein [Neospora caninum Liverpool]CEL68703.1 TPA: hypothetical protein BN1204_044450 [Neospora caninum Liverpool]|eukprot:XP_003881416.1 conserved hypothetical protein [Neospora caninum Liverpool]